MRSSKLAAALAVSCVIFSPSATAQSAASATPFGTPCAMPDGQATIGHQGLPVIGTSFSIEYAGPNYLFEQGYAQPVLTLGFSPIAAPVVIPAGLFPGQPPGCTLYTPHDVVVPMGVDRFDRGDFVSSFSLAVPNQPALSGAYFTAQWLVQRQHLCPLLPCPVIERWYGTSDAMLFTIG